MSGVFFVVVFLQLSTAIAEFFLNFYKVAAFVKRKNKKNKRRLTNNLMSKHKKGKYGLRTKSATFAATKSQKPHVQWHRAANTMQMHDTKFD